jgi:hypothetical protein
MLGNGQEVPLLMQPNLLERFPNEIGPSIPDVSHYLFSPRFPGKTRTFATWYYSGPLRLA